MQGRPTSGLAGNHEKRHRRRAGEKTRETTSAHDYQTGGLGLGKPSHIAEGRSLMDEVEGDPGGESEAVGKLVESIFGFFVRLLRSPADLRA